MHSFVYGDVHVVKKQVNSSQDVIVGIFSTSMLAYDFIKKQSDNKNLGKYRVEPWVVDQLVNY